MAAKLHGVVVFDENRVPVEIQNVSKGGLCFVSAIPLPLRRVIAVEIAIPGHRPSPDIFRAIATWADSLPSAEYRYGVSFIETTPTSVRAVGLLLAHLGA